MALISKTKLAILKELEKQPLHGYVLAKKLNITISSIYSHLNELKSYNFVESFYVNRKRVYRLTDKGKLLLKLLTNR